MPGLVSGIHVLPASQEGVDAHGTSPWAEGPRVKSGQEANIWAVGIIIYVILKIYVHYMHMVSVFLRFCFKHCSIVIANIHLDRVQN